MNKGSIQRWARTAATAAVAGGIVCGQAVAMTAAQLSKRLAAGENIRLVDVRTQARFATGSIPGAMNIPASVILEKPLPTLGFVVLFDDGLGTGDVAALAAALDRRAGWHVEVLEGGLAAWQALVEAPVTGPAGLQKEVIQNITYESLSKLAEPVVLLDVRPPADKTEKVSGGEQRARKPAAAGAKPAAGASDHVSEFCRKGANRKYLGSVEELRRDFSGARQNRAKPKAAAATATPPLVVLVDRINGDCRETARRLRNEGFTRVVILAGGDEAILLEGRRGKGRVAGVVGEGTVGPDGTPQPAPQSNP